MTALLRVTYYITSLSRAGCVAPFFVGAKPGGTVYRPERPRLSFARA